jgi:iron complex outermembrane receptor protein
VTVTSITNFTTFDFAYQEDCDGGPLNACRYPFDQHMHQYSEELRANGKADRLSWTTGVYFIKVDQGGFQGFEYPVLSGSDYAFQSANPVEQHLRSYAAFGQLEYTFAPKWRGTLGLRYTHDEKTYDSKVYFLEYGNGYTGGTGSTVYNPPLLVYDFSQATVGGTAKATAGMVSGKAQLDFIPREDALIYGSVSRGVKGPAFNTNNSDAVSIADTPVHSEWLMAYELGSKIEGFERRARLNASIFYYDYHDFQAFSYKGLSGLVVNKDARFQGAEAEATLVPLTGLTVSLGISYLDTLVKDVVTASRGVLDQQSANAPKWQGNASVRKSFHAGPGDISLVWDGNYIGDRFGSVDNTIGSKIKGSFVHNARVSYFLPNQELEVAAFLNNISNTARENFVFDLTLSTGDLLRSYAPPRMWGVSVRKSFK